MDLDQHYFSTEQLLAAGWTGRQIEAALDDGDVVGPSGHWLNAYGKPYYDKERVGVAAYRMGITSQPPSGASWERWRNSTKPTSAPLLAFDFHRLADACLPNASRQFWSLRLSHRVLGRQPGTRGKETLLIEKVLGRLVETSRDRKITAPQELDQFLTDNAGNAASTLGLGWPDDIVFRAAHRSYLSRATGPLAIKRFLMALSCVHAGLVRGVNGETWNIRDFLIAMPRMRFDSISLHSQQFGRARTSVNSAAGQREAE